jgi:hypothetical protein
MATDIEQELFEVFDAVGSAISPPPDLADLVRQQVRTRRRRLSVIVVVAMVVVGGLAIAVADHGLARSPDNVTPGPQPRFSVTAANIDSMAVGGNTLYVAISAYPHGLLTAYDRTTGSQLGGARLPARPSSVAVAADGTVWVTFYPSNAGRRAGVAEFSPNLSQRSTLLTDDHYLDTATFDVMPLGHDRALLATSQGLVTASLPPPPLGAARTAHANRNNALITALPGQNLGPPTQLAALSDGNIAVLLSSDRGRSRVILLHGAATVAGAQMTVAASPDGLWVTTGTGRRSVLRRFSDALLSLPIGDVITTASISGGADRVWTSGRTVWVAMAGRRIRLACFAFSSRSNEPSATVSLPSADSAQATDPVVTGDVIVVPAQQAIYVASPFGITSYPVPAVCQS